ncbi:MAG: hypothetical protein AAFW97_10985 [Pseudomonadota bacterium]
MDNFGWIEIAFTYSVVLGLALWQLWSVNRSIRKDKEKAARDESEAAPGHLVGEHPLDDGGTEPVER